MLCIPLISKIVSEVLAGMQELFAKLRRHRYPVGQMHTDARREFDNVAFTR